MSCENGARPVTVSAESTNSQEVSTTAAYSVASVTPGVTDSTINLETAGELVYIGADL